MHGKSFTKHALGLALTLLVSPCMAQTLHVAAAANLQKIFTEALVPAFEKASGATVVATFGSTALLAKQLENGAPSDVFVAADTTTITKLGRAKLLVPGSGRPYAIGQLVLWSRRDAPHHPAKIEDLAGPEYTKIAYANPQLAPYGLAAVQALTKTGLMAAVGPKLVRAENIGQALQFAQSGNADCALTALSLVIGDKSDPYVIIPQKLHAPLVQSAALVSASRNQALGTRFLDYLRGKQSAPIWHRYGYGLPQNLYKKPAKPRPRAGPLDALLPLLHLNYFPVGLSLKVASWATFFSVAVGMCIAYPLGRGRFAGRDLLAGLANLPLVLPPTVLGYALLVSLGRRSIPGRWYESLTGHSLAFTWQGAVVASCVASIPLFIGYARVALASVDPYIIDAARTDGAGRLAVARFVLLPAAMPGLAAGVSLAFARALGDFGATLMLAGDTPGQTQTLPLAIYDAVLTGDNLMVNVFAVISVVVGVSVCILAAKLVPVR